MRMHVVALYLSSTALCTVAAPQALADSAPATAFAGCGGVPEDLDGGGWYATAGGAVNMRSGASTGCPVKGVTYQGQALDYHCFANPLADDDWNWTYARNVSTGVEGWIRNDLLSDHGSKVKCR
ncbi:SH3 domain-containing protein [Streptomyces sp. NPDC001552]|uniref:SH3 domain-containing protein n=1 Tax=Streptomyces sp. NPDC001552 TaxID=3364587 RepID=UPI0036D171AD